jgi:hypothetical protein
MVDLVSSGSENQTLVYMKYQVRMSKRENL